jgi:hypothetical protein
MAVGIEYSFKGAIHVGSEPLLPTRLEAIQVLPEWFKHVGNQGKEQLYCFLKTTINRQS